MQHLLLPLVKQAAIQTTQLVLEDRGMRGIQLITTMGGQEANQLRVHRQLPHLQLSTK